MNKAGFKYNAFISYSHAADNKLAPRIQSALHKFAKPWYKLRQLHIYRDQTNLSISPELWPNIQKAISLSDYFLLFASQGAAQSKWVKREITWWIENRSADKLFIILTDGEVLWDDDKNDFDWRRTNALPNILSGKFKSEPNYIDFRQFKSAETFNLRDPSFLDNILSIAAPLHGKSKEELGGEDIRQHRITRLISWLTGLIIGAISVVAIWQAIVANQQRKTALEQSSISLARQLAAQSELIRSNDFKNLPLAVALATEALNIYSSTEIDHAAWESIVLLPELCNETDNWEISQNRFSPDGEYIATADGSKGRVWKVVDNTRKAVETNDRITGEGVPIITQGWSAVMAPDNIHLLTGNEDGSARLWDLTKKNMSAFNHGRPITTVAYADTDNMLATASDSLVKIWDVKTHKLIFQYSSEKEINSLDFDHNGKYLAIGSANGITILETSSWKTFFSQPAKDPVYYVAFSGSARSLVSIDAGNRLSLLNIEKKTSSFTKEYSNLRSVNLSPDKNHICLITEDKIIRLNFDNSAPNEVTIPVSNGLDIAGSPDNRSLAVSSSNDSTITLYDIRTGKRTISFRHNSAVNAASFDKTGRYLATACQDGTIHIRDLQTKTEISFITWNSNDPVEKVTFSSDGKYIIAASQQYKTSAWLWRTSDAIGLACRLLNYRLTEADWNLYMNGRKYQPVCR